MPKCIKIKRKHRQICIGDLDTKITLQDRTLTAPSIGVDASEVFTENAKVWSMMETKLGETIFDGTGTERDVTHRFTIRFITGITAETWILFKNNRIDILDVENLDERDEFLLLRATNRGLDTNRAGDA